MTNNWSTHQDNQITLTHKLLSRLSMIVRRHQFEHFSQLMKPKPTDLCLDVGARSDETLPDSNMFQKLYPYQKNLTSASIEDCENLFKSKYKHSKFIRIRPDEKLPFNDKHFDIVTSWATIEHVGIRSQQEFFLKELR